ncbi:MAG: DNA replication/repair protein RecF [Bacillota bacterium]|nr:DNA replication/repair protein RecF [Bacillota bacterium]
MYIKYLHLINFRNYEELNIELYKGINIFIGDNAQGKTNILESIYYGSLGKSHRASKDKDLVNWNKREAYVQLYVSKNRLDKKIEIKVFREGKKGINVNSIKLKKISELFGVLNVVMFSPEDLKIVKESPGHRRRFLDIELCKLNTNYYYNLVQYNKVLEQRNTVLRNCRSNDLGMIDIYDVQLSKFGGTVIDYRIDYINKLKEKSQVIHGDITSNKEKIDFKYITDVKEGSSTKDELYRLLELNRKKDMEKRITSIGPHRDDFSISINGIDTRSFGSQGQQRTAILTIKFASLHILKEQTGEFPVLLLDDVLSELDLNRQKYIMNSISEVQTVITCTGISDIKSYLNTDIKVFNVKDGNVIEMNS